MNMLFQNRNMNQKTNQIPMPRLHYAESLFKASSSTDKASFINLTIARLRNYGLKVSIQDVAGLGFRDWGLGIRF